MKFFTSFAAVLFILVVGFFAIWPLLQPGFFPMHDDTQVARVFEMGKALADGMFPVRWTQDLGYGYGYPIFTFYAPLSYYLGGFFMLSGMNALLATKVMMISGILFAGVSMYLFCKEIWGKAGGVIGAVLYLFATYHALDIYVRGDVAEFFAYAFVPLAAYGVLLSYKRKNVLSIGIGAIGFAGVIISHNLTAMMVTPFLSIFALLLSYILFKEKRKDFQFLFPLAPLVGGVLIAAFYWLPVFAEMRYTNVLSQVGGGADFRDHFVCLSQLWYSPWGYGGSVPGCVDGLSFMVGKLHLLAVVLSIPLMIMFWKKKKESSFWFLGGLVGFVLATFFTTSFSKPLWEAFHTMAFFQYPWRFLLLAAFFSSFLGAGIVILFRKRIFRVLAVIGISFAVILLQHKFFVPQKNLSNPSSSYTNRQTLTWHTSKISDEYMPKDFAKPASADRIPESPFSALHATDGILLITEDKTQEKQAIFETKSQAEVVANIAFFPAWQVYVDGIKTKISATKQGFIFPVSAGKHVITAVYTSTPVETAGNIVSLTSVFLLILAIIYERRSKNAKARI